MPTTEDEGVRTEYNHDKFENDITLKRFIYALLAQSHHNVN
jgi:hypothetical protein